MTSYGSSRNNERVAEIVKKTGMSAKKVKVTKDMSSATLEDMLTTTVLVERLCRSKLT